MTDLQAIVDFILTYKWFAIPIGIGIAALLLIRAYGGGVLKSLEKAGQEDTDRFFKQVDINDTTRAYLEQASKAYSRFKFRGLPRVRAKGIEPPQLDQAYISVRVMPESKSENLTKEERAKIVLAEPGGIHKQTEPVQLSEATKESARLAIIGVAGSGKSTLLQWAGLACARALLKKTLTDEQKEFVNALGGKPLVPFLIPLRAYATYCEKNKCSRSSKTLLAFMTEYFSDHHASVDLAVDFFKSHLQKGCLLMVDGLDEVDPEDRSPVRSAVEELLTEFDNPNLHCLLASRPSAIQVAEQMQGFQRCEVQRLTSEQRDNLIDMWYKAVLADDPREARRKSHDLSSRIEDSDQRVQELATTPLMITIFAMVHYSRDELPKQRAKLYEEAVEILLTEVPFKGEEARDLQNWGGMDWDVRRDRIARIAFELRERGKDSLLENDLVDLIWKRFGNEEAEARRVTARFLRDMAERGGLLESVDEKYGFYTHATFQEFLAGRYLAEEYPQEQLPAFLRAHIKNDLWDEALRLAVGYLAIKGEEKANRFIMQIADSGVDEETNARALYVAGLALADVPEDRRLPETVNHLVPQMQNLLTADPPRAKVRARFNLGLALGSLGDPRINPLEPDCVPVPAGAFRMGTNEVEERLLKEQNVNIYPDEKPAHNVYISEFSIGKYPVTNLEFRAFYEANGYHNQDYWSKDGWNWRTGNWDADLSELSEDLQKTYKDWLARRPVELRDKPFFWDVAQWNASNLPVVGVSWFEAEAYCKWLSHVTGRQYRLPMEAEWEKAARGKNNFLWSWGNTWNGELCNNADEDTKEKLGRTSPVGMYPNGASSYGVLDIIGNVWEWCNDWYDENEYKGRADKSVKDPQGPQAGRLRVLRGGSFIDDHWFARGANRYWYFPSY
ncbi:MAG: SUMF1/EgtB/PvdO family nonheme iron enzyme, partial [Chloroflexota bacterium]|nr:SUMF1/EgtB/PvdO family nonheme iron enzyme [Chloroflexota bacterium]